MFQNLGEQTIDSTGNFEKNKRINILSNIFDKKYVFLYIISLMVSTVGLTGEVSPFSISIVGASFANSIPLLGVVIVATIGNAIKFGTGGALNYLLTILVMVATLFMFKPKINEDDKNEKIKVAKNIFISTLLVQFAKSAMSTFTIYDILISITFAIITVVFYKIFVNSISVLENIGEKRAFSIEEVIGTSLLLAIAVSCFSDFSVFNFSIRNILSILIVLVLGWKNGVLIGTTSGVTIGVTLGIITGSEPIMIAAYAISGMIAGILNRFGKIGVILGFCIGNVVLAYVSNGYTVELIHFKEILIASIALLAIPKTIQIDIEDFVKNAKFFPVGNERTLTKSKETVNKLNNVSDTLKQMAKNYQENEITYKTNTGREKNKQIFVTELLDWIEPYKENILYEDLANTEGKIIDEIFNYLLNKQEITREALLEIFANCNSYIVGFDDKEVSAYLEQNISQMIRSINTAYRISKSNFIWMQKIQENKKNMKEQLNGVSKAISGIAKDIQKEVEIENQYQKPEAQIIELLKQKDITIEEINIKREDRFLIEIYTNQIFEPKIAEDILTKVLGERIVFNQDNSVGHKMSYLSDDKYVMGIGTSEITKSQNSISGDEKLCIRLKDGKYLVALSDGMGSGKQANESSTQVLKMLENLLLSGFDRNSSMEIITTTLINQNEEMFATLDVAIIDLYKGNIEFIKSGACPTYVKNKKKVQIIKSNSLPVGIVNKYNLEVFDRDIQSGEILFMCTDGVLDSNVEYKNKELWIKYLLEDIGTSNTKKIADIVLNEAIDNSFGKVKDDMSIIVCKFMEKDI